MLEVIERSSHPNSATSHGSIIWLHGLGADGRDFEALVPELRLSAPVRFVFPHAPVRPVTINGGMEMRAWYDVDPARGFLSGDADIRASAESVAQLVEREIERGVSSDRVLLAGFSQGGVIALHLGLRYRRQLAGVIALSTYLHDAEHIAQELSFENLDTPILFCHGLMDPMIPITRAVSSRQTLMDLNFKCEWHEYSMGHQVCPQEIMDIRRFIQARLRLPS